MPAIKARKQADGSTRYTAVVRIRRQGKVLHQEAKTFAHRSAAERWGKHREVALEDPSALVRAQQPSTKLASLIRWYIDGFQHVSRWQRTKQAQLVFLEKHPIGETDALSLESATLIDHIRSRCSKRTERTEISASRRARLYRSLPVMSSSVTPRILSCELRQHRCQNRASYPFERCDRNIALEALVRAHKLTGELQGRHFHSLGAAENALTERRKAQPLRGAIEEVRAQLGFRGCELPTRSWLRHAQLLRGTGERARARARNKRR